MIKLINFISHYSVDDIVRNISISANASYYVYIMPKYEPELLGILEEIKNKLKKHKNTKTVILDNADKKINYIKYLISKKLNLLDYVVCYQFISY